MSSGLMRKLFQRIILIATINKHTMVSSLRYQLSLARFMPSMMPCQLSALLMIMKAASKNWFTARRLTPLL
uniref:Uncharacterized protein n=1 Tax=Rhizophora mucronata TaxID=61149 RepID=A0A2P2JRJ2_RHIMU